MDFAEKTRVCSSLAAAQHIAADKALLRTVQPGDNLLHAIGSGNDFDKQLLWILLDFCSAEEINAFRVKAPIPVSNVPAIKKSSAGKTTEKKNGKKKTNTQILNGIVSKMKQYKKQLSSTMTG
jgi:hypothetical protein